MSSFEVCTPIDCELIKWSLTSNMHVKKNDRIGSIKDVNTNDVSCILSPISGVCQSVFVQNGDLINAHKTIAVIVARATKSKAKTKTKTKRKSKNNSNNNNGENNSGHHVCFVILQSMTFFILSFHLLTNLFTFTIILLTITFTAFALI